MAASTSCVNNKRYQYDVFLSFSGEDTRRSFVDHLNEALQKHGILTFKDDERLQKGKEIKDELLKSIEDSKYYIIVFSKKYASSSWCLDELVKIMECHKEADQTAFPVFYDVEPTEVRKQSGSVGEAFAKHTKKKVLVGNTLTPTVVKKALARNTRKKIGKWRKALKDAANLCGWELKNTAQGHEAKVIKKIVEQVSLGLQSINMGVDENLIGMELRMQCLEPYLEIGVDDVRIIGIKGIGGAGKTTLARAIFDKISFNFEGRSFVENVRENSKVPSMGLKKLQEQLLIDVLKDKSIAVNSVHEGTNLIKRRMCGKKVIIVLDDVDHKDQLEALAGGSSWFDPGSRIIITTRDEQVLTAHKVKLIKDVDLLSDEEAVQLFSRHAFREDISTHDYEMKSLDQVVRYADGLPLIVKVLGSLLCGKNKAEWNDALARLKTIPLKETLKILQLSYESLDDDYKEIFLDVSCFLRHWPKDDAIIILESLGFHARIGLRVLEQKSLLKTAKTFGVEFISMHDRIIEMGENIVRGEHPDDPNKHSRLWRHEEIEQIFVKNLGSEATRCIDLNITPSIVLQGLGNMKKLRCLIVKHEMYSHDCVNIDEARLHFPNSLQYLHWPQYPHWCLSQTFEANNLVTINMFESKIIQLWEGGKVMKKLKFINLSYTKLKNFDLGLTPNLERLDLGYCTDLVELNVHGGCLKTLVYLNLNGCKSLKSLVFIEQLKSLKVLHIGGLNLRKFPEYIVTGHSVNSLLELYLQGNDIEEVPLSIGNLHKLVSLDLGRCHSLKSLPESICKLQHLKTLDLGYTGIKELPEDIGQLECLEKLDLSGIRVKHLPRSICMLKGLKTLLLESCNLLERLPHDVGNLELLEKVDLRFCYYLRDIPGSFYKLKHLKVLSLEGCTRLESYDQATDDDIIQLCIIYDSQKGLIHDFQQYIRTFGLKKHDDEEPEAFGQLERSGELNFIYTNIKHLPDSICMLKHLKKLLLNGCGSLEKLPDDVGQLESLEELDLSGCYSIREVPNSICMLKHLKKLYFISCESLEKLPNDVGQLESLEELHLQECSSLREIPNSIFEKTRCQIFQSY